MGGSWDHAPVVCGSGHENLGIRAFFHDLRPCHRTIPTEKRNDEAGCIHSSDKIFISNCWSWSGENPTPTRRLRHIGSPHNVSRSRIHGIDVSIGPSPEVDCPICNCWGCCNLVADVEAPLHGKRWDCLLADYAANRSFPSIRETAPMVRPWSNDGDSLVVRVRYTSPNISVPIGTSSSPKNREIRPEFCSVFFQKLDQGPKHKTSRRVVVVVVVVVELGGISRIVQEHDLVSTCAELSAVAADEINTKASISVQRLTSYIESSGRRLLLITWCFDGVWWMPQQQQLECRVPKRSSNWLQGPMPSTYIRSQSSLNSH